MTHSKNLIYKILVLNSGSSSIKYKLFCSKKFEVLYDGIEEEVSDFHQSFETIFKKLISSKSIKKLEDISCVGHRVVHGGEKFSKPVKITTNLIKELESLISLAPLHNPANIDGIKTIKEKLPNISQVAVFDTAFHTSIPKEAFLYPIPYELYEKNKIRKYGFHGTSHQYVASKYAKKYNKELKDLNLITIHLGNGASVTCIKNGKSIDTSMGFTPLEGLMMGTRCGDIDPSIVLYLQEYLNIDIKEVSNILNKQSGLKGICKHSDLRKIISLKNNGDTKAELAINMFVEKIRKYIGIYFLKLEKLDAIIFTGGIGENSSLIRKKVFKGLSDNLGLKIDNILNESSIDKIGEIQTKKCKTKIVVIKTDEEKSIAQQTIKLLEKRKK